MRSTLRSLGLVLVVLVPLVPAQAPTVYVDPVQGSDLPGGGGPTNPLRSLTFAVQQVGPSGPATFRLRPGIFTAPAETFPIVLPATCVVEADPALVIRAEQSVVIASQPAVMGPALLVAGGQGAVDVTLRNLLLEGASYDAVDITAPANTGTLRFTAEDCNFNHYRDLVVLATDATQVDIATTRCVFRGLDTQIRVTARSQSTVNVVIDRGTIGGGWIGLDLIAHNGTVANVLRGVRLIDSGLRAVRMGTTNSGAIALRAEHCLFRSNGRRTVNLPTQDLGGITEDTTAVAGTRTVLVENSIFWGNINDCPHVAQGTYVFGRNIVQQTNLIGLGGNFNAAPQFVEAARNDYHLLPASPAVDAGVAAAVTLNQDFEGDPRIQGSAPDLGADENHPLYLYTRGAAHVGGPTPAPLVFRAIAPASTVFAGFLASAIVPNQPWGPGVIHLLPPIYGPVFQGTVGANGLGEVSIVLPVAPHLIGLELWWQGLFTAPPYLGVNPHRIVLRD